MRISDWSSDVCSSDLVVEPFSGLVSKKGRIFEPSLCMAKARRLQHSLGSWKPLLEIFMRQLERLLRCLRLRLGKIGVVALVRSEEHTSELQSLMRISYAVFRLKKKQQH